MVSHHTRLGWGDYCWQEIYFIAFDDQLKLLVDAPIRVTGTHACTYKDDYVSIVPTPTGFAVSPSDIGAQFDLATRRFAGSAVVREEVAPAPTPDRLAWGTRVLAQTLAGGAHLRVWLTYGEEGGPLVLHHESRRDAAGAALTGKVMEIPADDLHWIRMRLAVIGNAAALFVAVRNKIVRQRFDREAAPIGEPETLVVEPRAKYDQEDPAIFFLHAGEQNGECVILYQKDNWGLRLYSCNTGERREMGGGRWPVLHCAGGRCLFSQNGEEIRFLDP
jgi:hypothetical protein